MMASPAPAESPETDDDDASSHSEAANQHPVQSLVSGRAKRITAGNRLSSLLQEGDDELELLFAEEESEEDVDFGADDTDGASDIPLDSSTDEEDNDTGKADDELEGERELQQQDRTERQKKRKAHDVFKRPGALRRKPMIEPVTNTTKPKTPAARPRKKSERVSWIPTPDDGPTRSSTRKQTVQNKKSVHLRMAETEKRRVQLIHVMEEAAKRKEASKPKRLTQAERMEEAARTEERNAKSLNRWEETEKKRSDEQKAKLEALQNRHLNGPVITWWSGMATWINGTLTQVGCRGAKAAHNDGVAETRGSVSKDTSKKTGHEEMSVTGDNISPSRSLASQKPDHAQSEPIQTLQPAAASGSSEFVNNVRYSAPLPGESQHSHAINPGPVPHGLGGSSSNPHDSEAPSQMLPSHPVSTRSLDLSSTDYPRGGHSTTEYSTRDVVILDNVDVNDLRVPALQHHPLLKKRNGKVPRQYTLHQPPFPPTAADGTCRACSGAVRDHGTSRQIPRSPHWACLFRLVRLQGDPTASDRGIPVEYVAGVLCRPGCRWRSRGSGSILESSVGGQQPGPVAMESTSTE